MSDDRAMFVRGYTKVLTNAWSDDAFMDRLKADPKDVLKEFGLDTGSGKVELITEIHGEGNLDQQLELWNKGADSGVYTIYVPTVPQVDTQELSEADLDAVAAGDGEACCCCSSPCCCCT